MRTRRSFAVTSKFFPPPFNEVIDRVVEEYVYSVGAGGFNRCQIEARILDTPEFRRIHAIQVRYLEDIDLETPIIDYMRKRIYLDLNEHVGPNGTKDLVEVLAGSKNGDRFVWYRADDMTCAELRAILKALTDDEAQRPVQGNAARIGRLAALIQQRLEAQESLP